MNKSSTVFLIILSILIISSMCGCESPTKKEHTTQIFALDTVIDVTAYGDNAQSAVSAATQEIYRLEKLFSVTNKQSDIYRLNHSTNKETSISTETYELLKTSKELATATKGNFDVTIYPVLTLWGFTEKEYRVPSESEIRHALSSVSLDNLILFENNTAKLLNNAQIDLGGIAKGYIADKAAQAMKDAGCTSGLISLGGNIRTVGKKSTGERWNIGIKSPDSQGYFATVSTDECSVITSGAYQRNFTENGIMYHHIIDPRTGKPSDSEAVSVTIIGTDGAKCDALSTAIFIGGSEYAQSLRKADADFEYIILTKDKKVYVSETLKESVTLSEDYSDYHIIQK